MLPKITILGWSFSTYWMMFVIGVIGMAVLCCIRAKMYRLSCSKAIVYAVLLAVSGLLGTKLLYIVENWEKTLEEGITLGGQSFFGALFLVPVIVSLYGRAFGLRPSESTDLCAAPVILILMCMRVGCTMNGCCGGIFLNGFRVPAQFIEAVVDAGIFAYLLYKEKAEHRRGSLYPLLMFWYGVFRFMIEFLRDTEKDWLNFSHGQVFSIISIIVACMWYSRLRKGRCIS